MNSAALAKQHLRLELG